MKRFTILLVLGLLIFSACSNRQFYEDSANSVDSLSASLEVTASAYENLDTTLFQNQFREMGINLDSLRNFSEIALFPEVNIHFGGLRVIIASLEESNNL